MMHYNSPNFTKGINSKKYIILHHTATGKSTAKGIINSRTKINGLSCHYLVDELGQICSFNTEDAILWHAGLGERKDIKDTMNNYSIGIEVIGPLEGKDQFTDEQRKSVAYLIKDISKRNNIGKDCILRHKDYSPKRKVDIYDIFWKNKFKTREDYKNSLFIEDIEDKEKIKLIKQYMDIGSQIYNLSTSNETKKRLHDMNEYFRNI